MPRYSGRINLWLAGASGGLYALYLVAGEHWPAWMGQRVFQIVDAAGGVAGLTTALVVLAAVPAAFQYGLWDANAQDRCRRLELLLLDGPPTARLLGGGGRGGLAARPGLPGRGRVLWLAALVGGRLGAREVLAAAAAAVLLWALVFCPGFPGLRPRRQANGLGLLLAVGLPLAAWACGRGGYPTLAALLPPGMVYGAQGAISWTWLAGPVLAAALTLAVARHCLRHGDTALRAVVRPASRPQGHGLKAQCGAQAGACGVRPACRRSRGVGSRLATTGLARRAALLRVVARCTRQRTLLRSAGPTGPGSERSGGLP